MQKTSFRKYALFIFFPVLVAAAFVYFVASNDIAQYFENETRLANVSIDTTDSLIQQHVEVSRKKLKIFAEKFEHKIQYLVAHPEDRGFRDDFDSLIEKHFPSAVTYTLADSEGELLLSNLEGLVGIGCQDNIRLFAIDNTKSDAQLRMHHNDVIPHFDIMHEMHASDGRIVVFFITFSPEILVSYLANAQPSGHQLMIIKKDSDFSIELTEHGSKKQIVREPVLTLSEQDRILAKNNIPGTLWQLIDIINENTVNNAVYTIKRNFGFIFMAIAFGIILVVIGIMRSEKLR